MNELEQKMAEREQNNGFMRHNYIEMESVERDRAVFRLTIRPESKNPYGMVHGGAIYTLADNATGVAAHTDGRYYVTQTSALHFLRNQSEGTVRATAWGPSPGPFHGADSRGHHRPGRQAHCHGGVHLLLCGQKRDGCQGGAEGITANKHQGHKPRCLFMSAASLTGTGGEVLLPPGGFQAVSTA